MGLFVILLLGPKKPPKNIREKEIRMANQNLHRAKEAKNDEFYTQLTDVAEELRHYKEHLWSSAIVMTQHGLHSGGIST